MNNNINSIISNLEQVLKHKDDIIAGCNDDIAKKQQTIDIQNITINNLQRDIAAFQNAFWWKITKPMRVFSYALRCFLRSIPGARYLYHKIKRTPYIKAGSAASKKQNPDKYWNLNDKERNHQTNYIFNKEITFSILVPLYNTPENFFKDMIDSVISQTYTNWELCLADGSDPEHKYIKKIINSLPNKYKQKIKYTKLDKNLGISENTNACIQMATGDFFVLLDHDDALHPSALFECMNEICNNNADLIYSDECSFTEYRKDAFKAFYKPDFSPDMLRGCNYICHLTVFSKALQEKTGLFNSKYNGSQDHDMILRLSENAQYIAHIPKILYFWRSCPGSVASDPNAKSYAYTVALDAITDHLNRLGLEGIVTNTDLNGCYRLNYKLKKTPLISIIIPNKDNVDVLDTCINSVLKKSTYSNYEIIIVENNSIEPETFKYYDSIKKTAKIKILEYSGGFNYPQINNYAVSNASGEFIVLLNNDTEVIAPGWLEEMLMYAQREDVGAVGAMLYYPDDIIQHAGVIVGLGGVAGHSHKMYARGSAGYYGRLKIAHNLTAVTAACMMIPKSVYLEVNGLNTEFAVAFNDVDFCMRIRKAGYLIVWTPFAELYHYESKSRGHEDTPEKQARFEEEISLFQKYWLNQIISGDPYYNINLTLSREDFSEK